MKLKREYNEGLMKFIGGMTLVTIILAPLFVAIGEHPYHPPLWAFSGLMFFGVFCVVVLTYAYVSDFIDGHGSFYLVRRVSEPVQIDLRETTTDWCRVCRCYHEQERHDEDVVRKWNQSLEETGV